MDWFCCVWTVRRTSPWCLHRWIHILSYSCSLDWISPCFLWVESDPTICKPHVLFFSVMRRGCNCHCFFSFAWLLKEFSFLVFPHNCHFSRLSYFSTLYERVWLHWHEILLESGRNVLTHTSYLVLGSIWWHWSASACHQSKYFFTVSLGLYRSSNKVLAIALIIFV